MKTNYLTLLKGMFLLPCVCLFVSCGNGLYSVDFSTRDFPELPEKRTAAEEMNLKKDLAHHRNLLFGDLKASTDKKTYRPGEEVIVTVKNQSKSTEYFYPSDAESNQLKDLPFKMELDKENYKKSLVSKDPGILGAVNYSDPGLVFLIIGGANSIISSEFGVEGFDEPLKTGEEMVFNIKMPQREGHYAVMIRRYSHNPKSIGFWGASSYLYSNVFEITAH